MDRSAIALIISCCLILAAFVAGCTTGQQGGQTKVPTPVPGTSISITAGGKTYPAYLAVPASAGRHPGLVLIHSFNGLEPGYREMCDRIAGDGFVVIAPEWQTFNQRAGDPEVEAVVRSSLATLQARPDVDSMKLGLTGFCAGGRYTMLFLPQIREFGAGVAWYGFPYSGGFTNNTTPQSHITELQSPMLMIHGSRDQPSPVTDIYNYSRELDAAGKYFELKVYQGKPHGFMIANGSLVREDFAENAYGEMIGFFRRALK
jgi:carboxymethylenebutenolidase